MLRLAARVRLRLAAAATVAVLSAAPVFAQDNPALGGDGPLAIGADNAGAARAAVRSSPFPPPSESDRLFIVDSGPGLDTGCTYRAGGPLRFDIPVTRYVGPTAGGVLADPAALVGAGVVSPTAKLTMPVFDVDSRAVVEGFAPEVDRVVFNGETLGTLDGENNRWNLNAFDVPIDVVRFPERGAGGPPAPAMNTVEVYIDEANTEQVWCMGLDWASLEFKAVSPVLLVHGVGNNPGFWDRMGFAAALRAESVPFDGCGTCQTPINSPFRYRTAGSRLGALFAQAVETFGADSYHVVAHSKGGLDTRAFLATTYTSSPRMLSLVTLDSPHDGSLSADVLLAYEEAVTRDALSIEFEDFPSFSETAIGLLYRLRGGASDLQQLSTSQVAAFNATNVPNLPSGLRYLAVAADADRNRNGELDFFNGEAEDLISESLGGGFFSQGLDVFNGLANNAYQILREVRSVSVRYEVRDVVLPGPNPIVIEDARVAILEGVPTASPEGNDTVVTVSSARGEGGFRSAASGTRTLTGSQGKNHSTIADGEVARTVALPWILQAEREIGDLR